MTFKIKIEGGRTWCYFEFEKNRGLYILPYRKILRTRLMPLICFVHHVSNEDGKYKILDLIDNYDEQL